MTINPFDLAVIVLVLLLGLKGALVGVRRELFGFLGLIGGVFIASHTAVSLAGWAQAHLARLGNPAMWRLVAFILVLMLVWGAFSWLGRLLEARSRESAPSSLSRFGGFLLAASKYFLVFAMILSALYPTPTIGHKIQRHAKGSMLLAPMIHTGAFLLNRSLPILKSAAKKRSHTSR